MAGADYKRLYDEYWQRSDRWGGNSFDNVDALIHQILIACGGGRLLDVGCGMGRLARGLLVAGVDACALDVAPVVTDDLRRRIGDRAVNGSVLALPFDDDAFETVVATDVLEHIAEDDVPRALAELWRVTRRSAFVTISTIPDRDNQWHLTVHDRDWWQQRFFEAGFRTHPRDSIINGFKTLEHAGPQVTLVMEKLPGSARDAYPLDSLEARRMLHADMLRTSGRRADAHIARYSLAAGFVRPGDTVLDAACGLGYGAALLRAQSASRCVIGVDNSRAAIDYANANYAALDAELEFRTGDVGRLTDVSDASIDLVVALEILEHLPDPEAFLAEVRRVLKPAGRIVVSVPNDWSDESGDDPNPHHLHVYTWDKLKRQVETRFLFERAFAQTAGGGVRLADQPRQLRELGVEEAPAEDCEWLIAVGMKDAVAAADQEYQETTFADFSDIEDCHITAFKRDYDNPWLVKAIVALGMRNSNPVQLEALARRVLETAQAGSPDEGAALCVLAYRLLEGNRATADEVRELEQRVARYHQTAVDRPHAWRWRISNQYAVARLCLSRGALEAARDGFIACAELDPLRFSPLLATKTVDAFFQAGLIEANGQRPESAAKLWQRGLSEARRVLAGDWRNIWGRPENPASFGMPEVVQLARLATRCAFGLLALPRWYQEPGAAWQQTNALVGTSGGGHTGDAALAIELDRLTQSWRDQRRQLDAQAGRIGELTNETELAWQRETELATSWRQQRKMLAEQTEHIQTCAGRIDELEQCRDRAWDDLQRLRAAWEQQRALIGEQTARIAELEQEHGRVWEEAQRLAKCWDEQKAIIDDQTRQLEALRTERDQLLARQKQAER